MKSRLERHNRLQQYHADLKLVRRSGLFDPGYYASSNPDLAHLDARRQLSHYVRHGGFEGRRPHPVFDSQWYVSQNPELIAARINPLVHYLKTGVLEGRWPNPGFDGDWYLSRYEDVANAGLNPLAHYASHGQSENRLTQANATSALARNLSQNSFSVTEKHALAVQAVFGYQASEFVPVPVFDGPPAAPTDVRIVAFYLPQFHPIPENDTWWGKGFTEWTNVTRAVPQFEGHYQPHLPGELGFYDLRNLDVQKRQAELAALYGIHAFCIYFYWFNGHVLLERPLLNIIGNMDLKQTFCLCWANENWSRRWDGLENDLLMEQHYSDADDLEFIKYVSKYLKDSRYLRVGAKPVLVIYRPQLLPSMHDTARRWRTWCRTNGVGEIFLVCTHSFGKIAPADFGCDAAVEFPPNHSGLSEITASCALLNSEFKGHVHDMADLVERSQNYQPASYPLLRSVCPMWDNEARKPGKGTVLLNSSPVRYNQWLVNALRDTRKARRNPEERLVFVNAWNEWAEGAHLEPDRRHGYAYLEAMRVAQVRSTILDRPAALARAQVKIAIVVHVYYVDVLVEILDSLHGLHLDHSIFITTIEENRDKITRIMQSKRLPFEIFVYENRGRDVLPFLQALRNIDAREYPFVLKLHTKKSLHRTDGDQWRGTNLASLATPVQITWIIEQMLVRPGIGLVGAKQHVIPMAVHFESSRANLFAVARRLGVGGSDADIEGDIFIAGTMFLARRDSLEPILNISLSRDAFETETGQIDGTMAHAVERAFFYSAKSVGLATATINAGDAASKIPLAVIAPSRT